MGVRISWLMVARNSLFAALAFSAAAVMATFADLKADEAAKLATVASDTSTVTAAQAELATSTAAGQAASSLYATSVFAAPEHTVVFVGQTTVTMDVSDGTTVTTKAVANSTDPVPTPPAPPAS